MISHSARQATRDCIMPNSLAARRPALLRAGTALFALACGLAALPASAQDAAPATPTAGADPQEIVVTGSRVSRTALQSAVPVAILNNSSIEETGATNIQ